MHSRGNKPKIIPYVMIVVRVCRGQRAMRGIQFLSGRREDGDIFSRRGTLLLLPPPARKGLTARANVHGAWAVLS